MTKEDEYRLFVRAIHVFGTNAQHMKAIEELGELIRAIARFSVAGEACIQDDFDNLIDEITDVEIMVEQLKVTLMGSNVISLIQEQRTKKLERLEKRLDAIDKVKQHHGIN